MFRIVIVILIHYCHIPIDLVRQVARRKFQSTKKNPKYKATPIFPMVKVRNPFTKFIISFGSKGYTSK
jgi:hypothetical protein